MTPAERAEKLIVNYEKSNDTGNLQDNIAAQIEKACLDAQTEMYWDGKKIKELIEEAQREALRTRCYQCEMQVAHAGNFEGHVCEHMKSAYAEGFRACQKKAQEIADNWTHDGGLENWYNQAKSIAARIRAMEPIFVEANCSNGCDHKQHQGMEP